ncbi:TPA: hypothetical protein N0F65_007294 [Lagenidium giganteum]|uniref:Uncharacterized protein n=1 Tax=Lagenidium giganteum TaxID=4803 RepID=A0AAV2Z6U3_9STRA|nr:TPA: hypothetical protein N0F65_007294 [Lagenidium giganteum]
MPSSTLDDEDLLCRYPSKFCPLRRAVKKNGDLHSFCEFHRAKANGNQRRLEHRRRLQRERQQRSYSSTHTHEQELCVAEPLMTDSEGEAICFPSICFPSIDVDYLASFQEPAASTPRLAECVGSPTDSYQDWTAQDTTGRDHTTSSLDVELQCKYPSRNCAAPRAVKKTGDLHSFCELHRAQANRNQRRLEQKRRMLKVSAGAVGATVVRSVIAKASKIKPAQQLVKIEWVDVEALEPFRSPVLLTEEDLDMLRCL